MAVLTIQDTTLRGICDAVREKTGESLLIPVIDIESTIRSLSVGDNIDHTVIPDFVKAEAASVGQRVRAKIQADSIVIITGSDSHQIETNDTTGGNTMGGNL